MDTWETATYHAVLIAAAVIGTIICYFIVSVIRQQRKHRQLYMEKLEAEIITLEKERARVAADLHDELGPTLSAAKFKLDSVESVIGEDAKMINDAISYIDNILQQVRHIANGLMPDTLLRNGPAPAIEEFIHHMKEVSTVDISFQQNNIPPIPETYAIHIYRIVQEIIHNAVKHSGATKLRIELCYVKNKLTIATVDNGRGFQYDNSVSGKIGLGLDNLRSRTDILAGEFHISTAPGKGTGITIEIPVTV